MGRVIRAAALATLLLLACFAAGAEPRPDALPEALYHPLPQPPPETAGTGLAPSVRVRLHTDEAGRVSSVEVLSVEPPSIYDRAFARVTEQSLRRWRFLPRIENGRPVASTLGWSIQFPSLQAPGPLAERSEATAILGDEQRERFRRMVLSLPAPQRQQLLEQLSRRAEALIDPAHRTSAESEHFAVVTDLPQRGVAQRLARNFEAARLAASNVLRPTIPESPAGVKVHAYVYASDTAYDKLVASVSAFEWTAGFYHPAGLIALHANWPTPQHMLSIQVHEAVHALVDQQVVRPGVSLPRWLDEGLAEYLGHSDVRRGRLVPGSHRQNWAGFYFVPNVQEVLLVPTTGSAKTRVAKRAARLGRALSLSQLMGATPVQFYNVQRSLYYSQSWLVVHFLRHGEAGWDVQRFPRFVLYAAEGYPALDAFRAVYGADPAQFEERFQQYLLRF